MLSYLVLSDRLFSSEAISSPPLTSGKDKSKSPSARDAKNDFRTVYRFANVLVSLSHGNAFVLMC